VPVDYVATSNWAGNVKWSRSEVLEPTDAKQLAELIKNAKGSVRVIGTGHCFSPIANTTGTHIRLRNESFGKIEFLKDEGLVRFGAGVTYTKLLEACEEEGVSIMNAPSLPHITVVGSVMTGTHGSGWNKPTMGNEVVAVEFVRSDGTLDEITTESEELGWVVQSWGSAGVVTGMTMKTYPIHQVYKQIFLRPDWDGIIDNLEQVFQSGDYVSLFCRWTRYGGEFNSAWVGHSSGKAPANVRDLFPDSEELKEGESVHPVPELDGRNCIAVGLSSVNRCQYHFIPSGVPSSGVGMELQTEFFLPVEKTAAALRDLSARSKDFGYLCVVTELRVMTGDQLPLSVIQGPSSQRFVGIHMTWHYRQDRVVVALRDIIQPIYKKYGPLRPHVGKLFVMDDSLQYLFDKYDELKERFDPTGRFSGVTVATAVPDGINEAKL